MNFICTYVQLIDMYNVDGSQSGYALWKKPDQKDPIYVELWKM